MEGKEGPGKGTRRLIGVKDGCRSVQEGAVYRMKVSYLCKDKYSGQDNGQSECLLNT